MHTVEFTPRAENAVTREEYEQGRAVLDALPAGIYCKCSTCKRWQKGGAVSMVVPPSGATVYHCEKCAP